jgi:predicted DNA-binding transcriptional regulator AlpA
VLMQIVPFSPATLWRKVKAKQFPAPLKLSERATAWRVEDVRACCSSACNRDALDGIATGRPTLNLLRTARHRPVRARAIALGAVFELDLWHSSHHARPSNGNRPEAR